MKKIKTTEHSYLECDGCQYVISISPAERGRGPVTVEERMTMLRIPWRDELFAEFHFHGPDDAVRHDCFRYWAHSPDIMRRSLRERDWLEGDIEEFMATHLYRTHKFQPGIERPA